MKYLIGVLTAVIVGLGGLLGGYRLGEHNASAATTTAAAAAGTGVAGGAGGGLAGGGGQGARLACPSPGATPQGGNIVGTVTKVEGNKITVHNDRCGTDATVTLADRALVSKVVNGVASDVTNGIQVQVRGRAGTDGTLQAQSVTIIPPGFSLGGAGGAAAGGG
jgi:hypothetical protein